MRVLFRFYILFSNFLRNIKFTKRGSMIFCTFDEHQKSWNDPSELMIIFNELKLKRALLEKIWKIIRDDKQLQPHAIVIWLPAENKGGDWIGNSYSLFKKLVQQELYFSIECHWIGGLDLRVSRASIFLTNFLWPLRSKLSPLEAKNFKRNHFEKSKKFGAIKGALASQ